MRVVYYTAYGHRLASEVPLPDLPIASHDSAGQPDITVTVGAHPVPDAEWPADAPSDWIGRANDGDSRPWLTVGRSTDGFVLQFGRTASFSVSRDVSTVMVHHPGVELPDAIRHLLIDQVVPLALAHRGALVLHGSGLILDDRAIGLFGPSGTGKSTLAASLSHRGSPTLADDALVIEPHVHAGRTHRVLAHPAYPGLRVWPDVLAAVGRAQPAPFVADYTEKRRVGPGAGGFFGEPCALRRLYLLDPDEAPGPRIVRLSKRAGVMAILTHSYVLDAADARRLSAQLGAACAVLDAVDVRSLSFPRDLDRLSQVREVLRRDLAT